MNVLADPIATIVAPARHAPHLRGGASARLFVLDRSGAACATCSVAPACLPGADAAASELAPLLRTRIRVRRGEALVRAGDAFTTMYIVRVGAFKCHVTREDGRALVTAFPMRGDLVGFDGMAGGRHQATVVALEDSEACAVEFDALEDAVRRSAALQHRLLDIISRQMADDLRMRMLLATMSAQERLATFLCDLSARFRRLGYSASQFVLRMTREDIGSYLGLELETVSRLFTRLRVAGVIDVEQRSVRLVELDALRSIAAGRDHAGAVSTRT